MPPPGAPITLYTGSWKTNVAAMRIAKLNKPIVFLAATIVALASHTAAGDIQARYTESLRDADLRPAVGATSASRTLTFDAFGRHLDFELEPNSKLLASLAVDLPDGVEVYRGRLANTPGSWARFLVVDGTPTGLFHDGREMYALEAPDDATGAPVVFRLADLEIEPGALGCSHGKHSMSAAQLVVATAGTASGETRPPTMNAAGASANLDVGVVADADFTSLHGGGATTALLARMNIVDGIFSEQLGVQISVTEVDAFTAANDPFTDESDSNLLLDELADFRFSSPAQRATGLTHLFTGRELDGNNVGVAFSSALCLQQFGAGLTATQRSQSLDALIAAHEIGHNFGAPHDNEAGSACESTPGTFIMAAAVNGSEEFSACSISQMEDDIAAAACITALAQNDVEVLPSGLPGTVDIGDAVTVSFDVRNVGAASATSVVLDVAVPANATLDSASVTTGGNCTSGAGVATCSVGTLAGGASATMTIQATAASAGTANFNAAVSATIDTNASNNSSSIALTVGSAAQPVEPPSGGDPSSGGGAPGWPLLLALAVLGFRPRRDG